MSDLLLNAGSAPNTPAAGKVSLFIDTADKRVKQKDENGVVSALVGGGVDRNLLINSGFAFAQRQVPSTVTTYSNTTGRSYTADRWAVTNENASVTFQQVDSSAAPETGLLARYYGKLSKLTTTGKMILSQVLEGNDSAQVRGRTVRVQAKIKGSSAFVVRLGLIQLTSAGTVDTLPATFASAFGANGVDPTWGTNLATITPTTAENSTISSGALSCTLSTNWTRFSGTFDVPSTAKNLMVVVWTNNQAAAGDAINITEVALYDGPEIVDYTPRLFSDELSMCQRFFCKTFPLLVAPAQNAGVATGGLKCILGKAAATALAAQFFWRYPTVMRSNTPTITLFSPGSASAQARQIGGTAGDLTATATANITDSSVDVTATGLSTGTVGDQCGVHATAEAEL